ncbi:MAG: PTS system mannose/fructose/sorbose family transporter subunit IID [Erysipelotrichaceae bacterium]|jgi:mannose/fructose/N-acetylgalactosamine-specific phosphotransferase system component IID|nr:PTS system mannose/fructose/sorbose family transporter subunit IID [Erysipelotrichaceae bacterium]MBQ1322979.1 PTS system mannose/fructose/sorbose family transporter subunit IID [Erysipelotrichaceae bacterium]MBQ1775915.1 PTS system mannose/fructose/sorbose family transporter subunit IID [Erysipelotrichaceae bacterium]MBQ1910291.1 PTS system mannose/fructose/sorbose family transporter subunit IID [Erysipelotrichaceae bacterium]MBQ2079527.1 PTS system mannose/fructose/sorbose family transport
MARELSKKEFNTIFWRSFTLLGSFNYERMEGLGFLYAILPSLKRIYKDDPEGLKQAEHRHMEAFNMTVAPSPFVMGLTVAMEEQAKEDPSFDKGTINALKVSLMGPLSGIGDTFFWGIFRVLACSLGASFALQGNILGPIVLLLVFNIPNFLTRYYGLRIGYGQGAGFLDELTSSGKMNLFTYCAGIVGMASVGCLTASWIGISSPLVLNIAGNEIIIQEYLDQLCPQVLSLAAVLIVLRLLKNKVSTMKITVGIIVIAFILGTLGIIA